MVHSVLKSCPLFKGFTETGVQIVSAICTARTFPKGTQIFVEGGLADFMAIVSSGRVVLSTKLAQGNEVSLGELGQGDVAGELALLQVGKRMCTATAGTEVEALIIQHADFQKLMGQKPQACAKLLMNLSTLLGQKMIESREHLRSLLEGR